MKTLNCIGGETGKIEFQNVRGGAVPPNNYESLMINGVDYIVTKRYIRLSSETRFTIDYRLADARRLVLV